MGIMPGLNIDKLTALDNTIAQVEKALQRLSAKRPRLVLDRFIAKGLVVGELTLVINDEPLPTDTPLLLTDADEALGIITLSKGRPMSVPEFKECSDQHGIQDHVRKKQWPAKRRLYKHEVEELQPWSRPQLIKADFAVPAPRYTAKVTKDILDDEAPVAISAVLQALDGIEDALQPAASRMVDLLQLRGDARANLSRIGEVLKCTREALEEMAQDLSLNAIATQHPVDPFARAADALLAIQKMLEQVPTRTEVASRLQDSLEHLQAFAELEGVENARPMEVAAADAMSLHEGDDLTARAPEDIRRAAQRLRDLMRGPLQRYEQAKGGLTVDKAQAQLTRLEAAGRELGCLGPQYPHDFDDGTPRTGAVHLLCRDDRMSLMLSHDLGNGCCANYAISIDPPVGCIVPRRLKDAVLLAKTQPRALLSQLLDTPAAALYSCELGDDIIDVDKARFEPGEMYAHHSEGPALLVKLAAPTITLGYSDEDVQELFLEKEAYLVGRLVFDHKLSKAKWSQKYINSLPDSAFLYIEPGGKKDSEGKTVPRSKRHFPVRDKNGKLDAAHIRNAISRIPQSNAPGLSAEKKKKLQAQARKLLFETMRKSQTCQVDRATLHSDLTPHILSAAGAVPAPGRPCMPAALTKSFADQFWDEEDPAAALAKLMKARAEMTEVLAPGALQVVDGEVCQVVVKYYVEGQQRACDDINPPAPAAQAAPEAAACQVQKSLPRYPIKKRAGTLRLLKQETREIEGEEERYILGVVLVPNEPDSHGDIYSEKDVRDAAHFYMECSQTIGLEHERALASNKVFVLESYLAPCDFDLNGQHVSAGTWLMAARVLDDELWEDIKKGRITGWSIEGSAIAIDIV